MKRKHLCRVWAAVLSVVLMLGLFVPAVQVHAAGMTDTVSFDTTDDAEKFDLYQSGAAQFVVQDGRLTPTGSSGECKAIYKDSGALFTSVSLDIYPGSNGINSGIYLNVADVGDGRDEVDALCVILQSDFTGWTDAPNRIDIIVGSFPTWKEYHRTISETGSNNNLFSGGVKQPVTLQVDIADNVLTITVRLISDPSKSVTTTYTHTGVTAFYGDVGIRSNFSNASYDNFAVSYVSGAVARVGETYYTSVSQAIAQADGGVVKLLADCAEDLQVNSDLTLDLNGFDVTGDISGTGTLYGMDSANDTYDADKCGMITGKVTCPVAETLEVNAKDYIAMAGETGYTFHRVYVGITHVSLQPDNVAFGYKATFAGDETVRGCVTGYGYRLGIDPAKMRTFEKQGQFTSGQTLTLRLKNILRNGDDAMNQMGASATVYGSAYAALQVGGKQLVLQGSTHEATLQNMLEAVNANWSAYAFKNKLAVKTLVDTYLSYMTDWGVDDIKNWQAQDNTLKILAIGNSFSIDGMEYVYQIARNLGVEEIKLGNLYIGGCTLNTHWNNLQTGNPAYIYYTNEDGNWVAHNNYDIIAAIESENWDYITFQQASGFSGVADTYDVLKNITAQVKQLCPDAKFGWHMTWAYQGNSTHADFAKYNNDQNTMYQAITDAVQSKILTDEQIDFVIPSGTAIQNARTSYLGDRLTRDGFHLSYDIGRYIAGLTWVQAITGKDISDITFRPAGVSKDVMALAVECVQNAGENPYEVTPSAFTLEDRFIQLNLSFTPQYYNSTLAGADPQQLHNSVSALPFYATKIFTRAQLPVGSVIVYTGGINYRPEGWVDGAGATRPGLVTSEFTVIDEAWWGDWTERAFNINVGDLSVTSQQVAEQFKIYVPVSAYEQVDLTVTKAFYNAALYPADKTQAASTSLKFFCTQTFTKDTLPTGSIIINSAGKNIRLEGWYDGSVKNADGMRGGNTTATQILVDDAWWGDWTVRGINVPVTSLEDSQIDVVKDVIRIYIPKESCYV